MRWLVSILLVSAFAISSRAGWQFESGNANEYCKLGDKHVSCHVEEQIEKKQQFDNSDCFRAAVYEHNRKDLVDSKQTAEINLDIFANVTKLAGENGANIIVFPEDGLYHGTRMFQEKPSEFIPDPKLLNETNNNPCKQPELFKDNDILQRFSCMARENKVYLVANYGTRQVCDPNGIEPNQVCPDSGHLLLNTDVVFDTEGRFIARYRKYNLFIENFDKAPSVETVYFDTPFGRFGVFTCFDIMFNRPALELVEKYHVDTVIFPTLWYDELPLLTAIQFQDGWSLANKVNLLASNMLRRDKGTVGSGVYSAHSSYYTSLLNSESRLLIANVPKKFSQKCPNGQQAKTISFLTEFPQQKYTFINYNLLPTDAIHTLSSTEDTRTFCSGRVCCTISYKMSGELMSSTILIIRDGIRHGYFNWYEQVCALATIRQPIDLKNLNNTQWAKETQNFFEELTLSGNFSTKYVFPIAAHSVSHLIERDERSFDCEGEDKLNKVGQQFCQLSFEGAKDQSRPVYSFGLYGRIYENDKMPENW